MSYREQPRPRNARGELLGTPGRVTLMSAAELMEAVDPPSDWGPWRLGTRSWVLYPTGPYRYEVDLEECLDSARVLDWIAQVAQKTWADNATVAGLIRALDDVLQLQGSLCGCGTGKTITTGRVRQLARWAAARRKKSLAVYGDEVWR